MKKRQIPLERDLIWMAGFIDGEGSLSIVRQRGKVSRHYEASIRVYNTDARSFVPFLNYYGGKVSEGKQMNDRCKRCFQWRCPALETAGMLRDLYPYLRLKYEKAQLMLELLDGAKGTLVRTGKRRTKGVALIQANEIIRREYLYLQVKQLNRRGRGQEVLKKHPAR